MKTTIGTTVNSEWLITGKGEMLKSEPKVRISQNITGNSNITSGNNTTIERMGTTKSKFKGHVDIIKRIGSPTHDIAYSLKKVTGASADEVFYSKKVQRLIAKTPGKKIDVRLTQNTKPGERGMIKYTYYTVKKVYSSKCLVQYKLVDVKYYVFDKDWNEIDDAGNVIDDTVKVYLDGIKLNN